MTDRIAIVTGASPKGTFVRTLEPHAEGMVVRGEHGMDVGDRVTVKLGPGMSIVDAEFVGSRAGNFVSALSLGLVGIAVAVDLFRRRRGLTPIRLL